METPGEEKNSSGNDRSDTSADSPGAPSWRFRLRLTRTRFYWGLVVFVVVAGLSVLGVPTLRHRLFERTMALKAAWSGDVRPATAHVGDVEPLPEEYRRPEPTMPQAPQLPPSERVFTLPPEGSGARSASPPRRVITPDDSVPEVEEKAEERAETGPKYQKGTAEQNAYDLLLKSNPAVAGLVKGSDPARRFKSWDAASRGEDTYWVRLIFESGGANQEYIWQVKLSSSEVTPLSHNARTIS